MRHNLYSFSLPLVKKENWKALLLLAFGVLLSACANPGSGPDGGPYDETPPKIIGMNPQIGGTNVKTKKVTIEFDELIKIENAQEKIIVSPPQIETPDIKTSSRRISVSLNDTLKPNTTYTVDFSDAIVDSNEGNPLGNFTYYFSTGEQVDTMEVSGNVLAAEDLEPIKGILVGLHSNLADSAFTTQPFDRVARTDGSGHFCIKGVAPGEYRVYALKDMDNDFKYIRGEMLAFSHDTIRPRSFLDLRHDTLWADTVHIDTIRTTPYTHYLPDDIVLLAFTEQNTTRALLKSQREPNYFRTFFTAPSSHIPRVRGLNFDSRNALLEQRSVGNDTITYWLCDTTLFKQDSLVVEYTYEATNDSTLENEMRTDTLELVPRFTYERRQKLEREEYEKWLKGLEKRHKRGNYSQETPPAKPLDLQLNSLSDFSPISNVRFSLDEPAARFDSTAIHLFLKVDSTYVEAPFRIDHDSLSLLDYTIRAEWRSGQQYVLNIDSAAVTGLSGKVNKAVDTRIKVKAEDTYGSLFLLLPDADSSAVVQLLSGGKKIVKQLPVSEGRVDFFYVKPGDYYVRLFNDHNHNGRWDTGCYAEDKQAEEVYYCPQRFSVRANWDIEQTWRTHSTSRILQKPRELVKQKADKQKTPKNRNAERERNKRQ